MTKDEMKNKISMALKDPILQQGFEVICKNLEELENDMETAIPLLKKATVINEQLVKATKLLQEVQVYTENIDDEADALYDKIQYFLNEQEKENC